MARILAIDDDRDILRVLRLAFESAGHEVVTEERSDRIDDALLAAHIDAVVLDIMMPGKSGWEVLADLRANPSTTHLPVLLLSAIGDPHNRVRGIRLGADDFVSKPFDADEVIARTEGLIARCSQGEALHGDLAAIAVADVAQAIAFGERTGRLVLLTRGQAGWLEFDHGHLVASELGALRGIDAALELVAWTTGRFRFVPASQTDAAEPHWPAAMPRVEKLLLEATWLRDELDRLESFIPPTDAQLYWVGGEAPADFAGLPSLPLAQVQQRLQGSSGATLKSLVVSCGVATSRFLLAVAALAQRGYIGVESPNDLGATLAETSARAAHGMRG